MANFERWVQEQGVISTLIVRIAEQLRRRHGEGWLVALYDPSETDQLDIVRSVRGAIDHLAAGGRGPAFDAIASEATQWTERFITRRKQQWHEFGKMAETLAVQRTQNLGAVSSHNWVIDSESRKGLVGDLARQLEPQLAVEQAAANDREIVILAEAVVKENLGAGALEEYLLDPTLTEIMVGAGGRLWVERNGRLEATGRTIPEHRARWYGQRVAAAIGSRVDQSVPMMDGHLPDGSRVHVILPPLAMDGVTITIRRHSRRPTLEQFLETEALSQDCAEFLEAAVRGRANIIISGGTSSGKTTVLNILAGFIPPDERVLTLEDAPELQLPLPHVIRMRTRRKNIEGHGEVTMRDLVREALRMRPDRIVIGEVRGAEGFDMIVAFNTGHDGGISTAHANNPSDLLSRLATMCRWGDASLSETGAYDMIQRAVHLVVHVERRVIGGVVTRGVQTVVEVEAYRPSSDRPGAGGFILRPLFQRGASRALERIGTISERLGERLTLNGVSAGEWLERG